MCLSQHRIPSRLPEVELIKAADQGGLTSLALQPAAGHSRDVCSAVAGHVATWLMGQVAALPGWHSQVGVMDVCPGTPPIHPAPAPVVSALSAQQEWA